MKKNKEPAVLFYTSDFLSGASDLTMEERGQYITLLCLQHQKGHLSMKQIKLAVGKPADDVLAKFIKDAKGKYYNKRMEEEQQKRKFYNESRYENGKNGGRPKNHMDNHMHNHMDNHMDNHMGNHTENENNYVIHSSNLELCTDIFPFSNNNNNNNIECCIACTHDKYDNIELEIMEYFAKHNFDSNAEDFIAYNESREWKGFGGEDVREDYTRYADRWEEENLRRKGIHGWKPPII